MVTTHSGTTLGGNVQKARRLLHAPCALRVPTPDTSRVQAHALHRKELLKRSVREVYAVSCLDFLLFSLETRSGHWVSASPADCVRFTATAPPPPLHAGNWSIPAVAGVALTFVGAGRPAGPFPGARAALGRFLSARCHFGFKAVNPCGERSLDWETEPAGGRSLAPPRLVPAGSPRPPPFPGAVPVPLTPRHCR